MKFSEQWLREWVNPQLDSTALESLLSLAGLEVDDLTPAAGAFSGVVVGEIIQAEPHPNADKLQVCTVNNGQEQIQVVCGAPNARPSLKTAFAQVGAVLPGDFKIKKAKLRQVESFGMLSSEKELGISEENAGIMELAADAPVGTDLRDYLQLDDQIFDVDLTPNRADCLSLSGMAREVGVITRQDVQSPQVEEVEAQHDEIFPIQLDAPQACPRYLGRIIKGVNIQATTPLWMRERLRRSGIRSIDPVVDVTNYVMLELGQPMHAFDLAQLSDRIVVRYAEPGEQLTLLDDSTLTLARQDLVIADQNKALALAGIMGGQHSGCHLNTQDIFLEVAYFDPIAMAGRARAHGLHTDSSHRFERGVDFKLQHQAMARATALLLEIAGGQPGPINEAVSEGDLPTRTPVILRKDRLAQLLAVRLEDANVADILTRLGLIVTDKGDHWYAEVPSYRFDITLEVDLIEEVARIYGYDNLPVTAPRSEMRMQGQQESLRPLRRLREQLVANGYQEAVTYSFIDPKWSTLFDPEHPPIPLANPISTDLAVMRTSLLPGLVKALLHNQKRQQPRVRLFETGLRFIRDGEQTEQTPMLSVLASGNRLPESWHGEEAPVDFYDLKGDLESILEATGEVDRFSFETAEHPALHPGQSARILKDDQAVGWIGALHPALCQTLEIKGRPLVFEITLEAIQERQVTHFEAISKYPEMRRDLAVLVEASLPVAKLLDVVRQSTDETLVDLRLFDVYQGQGVPEGQKSLALGLTWQHPSRTLTDDEINAQVEAVVTSLQERFAATLRS
ncbi:phenylalanine--tRNA ligase subunit beta [Terasakiispira papahanaumokuakeensis]|uniref:Phenylalanine--tRNA ligase beta subunit n=1 Tax=Terasakiispira papahanaumokuakeensis TaxID=197479 RepID=A0A1E2V9A5_9GAMM|nr:phenylalanine--tRNA ligase subunit beta [Terasakiispira papahanaumokuakeensis]ODC03599.1 phenylalanine--tRNA ligase subunit beta [Terasakiispira papahanaumokuakeensis]